VGSGQNGEQPGAGRRRVPQLIEVDEGSKGAVLKQVLCVGLVAAAEPERRPEQRVQMLG
jgi:hypothetical protein